MIIVAGYLSVAADKRDVYLAGVRDVTHHARSSRGCIEFVQAPDPLLPYRIAIYERWESDDDLIAFRPSDPEPEVQPGPSLPEVLAADVHKFRISAVESP